MSGFRLMGRRMKATMPMKNSTTNSTTGDTGWRIAQAEIFFMRVSPCDRDALALAQETACGDHDAFAPCEAFGDDDSIRRGVRHSNGASQHFVRGSSTKT